MLTKSWNWKSFTHYITEITEADPTRKISLLNSTFCCFSQCTTLRPRGWQTAWWSAYTTTPPLVSTPPPPPVTRVYTCTPTASIYTCTPTTISTTTTTTISTTTTTTTTTISNTSTTTTETQRLKRLQHFQSTILEKAVPCYILRQACLFYFDNDKRHQVLHCKEMYT